MHDVAGHQVLERHFAFLADQGLGGVVAGISPGDGSGGPHHRAQGFGGARRAVLLEEPHHHAHGHHHGDDRCSLEIAGGVGHGPEHEQHQDEWVSEVVDEHAGPRGRPLMCDRVAPIGLQALLYLVRRPFVATVVMKEIPYKESYGVLTPRSSLS